MKKLTVVTKKITAAQIEAIYKIGFEVTLVIK